MNAKAANVLRTVAAAVMLGPLVLSSPAVAGGSIAFYLSPQNGDDAQMMDLGLRAYALYNGLRHGANVRQHGHGNNAGIGQNGGGNLGIVDQQGDSHSATLQQNGNGNSYGVFQFGRNTDAEVVQNGQGQSGAALLFGW
ncbi:MULTISPECIES: curlin [Phyllobacteriaceae]|jgi:hypothetical protein|uniref:Curlin n=1 Tax=Mesorhizobium hungaricum TaxID=1566387 RepID=A0A1C2DYU5_9HYPH|nr:MULTISPECIES: curlin [Mesorhizobium]MBN9234642.1 curlin [Mesorhizobium sp.]MDQ0328878.1 major curlin subunit [Mesorhizobium sp. YL-MeA3-2017]OCX19922.1 curlin [Mesorhizobium hungaricum]